MCVFYLQTHNFKKIKEVIYMALDVTVSISAAAAVGKIGFGIPLVLTSKGTTAIPYIECAKLSEVATLCGDNSTEYKIAKLMWAQENAPTAIAFYTSTSTAETAVSEVVDKDWRQLIVVFGTGDTTTAANIAGYIEATDDKMYFVTVSTSEELAAVKGNSRTVAFYYDLMNGDDLVEPYAVAALVGETAGRVAGSYTYKNLILKGLTALEKTTSEIETIHSGGGITLLCKAGDIVTSEGKNTDGEYIDIVDSKDWIIQQIEYQAQKLLNNSAKLPYSDAGIAALESVVTNVLQDAFNNGIISTDSDNVTPMYSVDFQKRSAMSTSDRQNRIYTGGNFTFTLAGAIHTATIDGELVI
jgi:hypothetical protein